MYAIRFNDGKYFALLGGFGPCASSEWDANRFNSLEDACRNLVWYCSKTNAKIVKINIVDEDLSELEKAEVAKLIGV